MSSIQASLIYSFPLTKLFPKTISYKSSNRNNFLKYIITLVRNPIFAIIVSPLLAYECFFNIMPYVLDFSYFLCSIIITVSFVFLLIPIFEVLFILRKISIMSFNKIKDKIIGNSVVIT